MPDQLTPDEQIRALTAELSRHVAALQDATRELDDRDSTISSLRDDVDFQTKAAFANQADADDLRQRLKATSYRASIHADTLYTITTHLDRQNDEDLRKSIRETIEAGRQTIANMGTAPVPGSSRRAQERWPDAEETARLWHNTYEKLMNPETRIPWREMPEQYRKAMIATAEKQLDWLRKRLDDGRAQEPERPRIVVLCGSTRFKAQFEFVAASLTLNGAIVIKPDVFMNDGHAEKAHLPAVTSDVKRQLDELHKQKIDLADEVLVLNVGGYIGDSTRSEIEYAERSGKPISYLTGAGPKLAQGGIIRMPQEADRG